VHFELLIDLVEFVHVESVTRRVEERYCRVASATADWPLSLADLSNAVTT
jgi:hypothetical protein